MLAEEMGLGKTVEIIALVLSHPRPPPGASDADDGADDYIDTPLPMTRKTRRTRSMRGRERAQRPSSSSSAAAAAPSSSSSSSNCKIRSGATLVAMPRALAAQWMSEVQHHAPHASVVYYDGEADDADAHAHARWLAGQDIVLVQHEVLEYPYREGALSRVNWWRLVVDEAHLLNPSQLGQNWTEPN